MIFGLALALVAILIDVIAVILWRSKSMDSPEGVPRPMVSVLVAMRNEEHNVKGLVQSLRNLDYPQERIEFLIGEDRSTDGTYQLLQQEIGADTRFKIIRIFEDIPGLVAKANVIAQLIAKSHTQYYFITDADVRVPATWITALLTGLSKNDGAVGGTTVVKVKNLWTGLQNMDWLLAQGLLSVARGIFGTQAISGTNMMITKEACDAIGGYQNIPYSLTEDIGLLTAIKKVGFSATNVLNRQSMATIEGLPNWQTLIAQRARWTYGVFRIHPMVVVLLGIRSLFLIMLLLIIWTKPWLAMVLLLLKWIISGVFLSNIATALGQPIKLWHFMCFEIYCFLIALSGSLSYLFSSKIHWKDRAFG